MAISRSTFDGWFWLVPEESAAPLQAMYGVMNAVLASWAAQLNAHEKWKFEEQLEYTIRGWAEDLAVGTPPASDMAWLAVFTPLLAEARLKAIGVVKSEAAIAEDRTERQQAIREDRWRVGLNRDREAKDGHLFAIQFLTDDGPSNQLKCAQLDKVVVAKLEKTGNALGTTALASCTGVSLYDPVTKVGALMHVYKGAITIEEALREMKKIDSLVIPANIQAGIMPGDLEGVNGTHTASILDQLAKCAISTIRNFGDEGRMSSDYWLLCGGSVAIPESKRRIPMGFTL